MKRFTRSFISIILTIIICISMVPFAVSAESESTDSETTENGTVYLSDISYKSASVGYGKVHLDGNMDDNKISVYVDGNRIYFDKGLTFHATATVVYDLTNYSDYNYFTSYIGVDASQGGKGNVIYHIYTSEDGTNWSEQYVSGELTSTTESEFVSIDISQANYLKFYIDSNGGNGNDHSVLANAKLAKSIEDQNSNCKGLKTLDEYDEILAGYKNNSTDYSSLIEDKEFEHILLQRTLVKNAGYKTLSILCQREQKYVDALEWLLNDDYDALSLYVIGGKPSGTYEKSLEVLYDLLNEYGDDINDPDHGELYKKMIITLSLTHSATVYAWQDSARVSDPLKRYQIYKDLYLDGLLWTDIFENLTVDEMRWVLNGMIDDDEIKALNTYVRENNNISEFNYTNWCGINGYNYINYTMDYSYPEHPSIFDIFEQGAVCGGISKSSCNIRQVFGVPAATFYQPAHCAWLDYRYNIDGNGKNVVYIGNNVSGWTKTHREYDDRIPCGWGNASWRRSSGYCGSYTLLSRKALNNFDDYKQAELLVYLSDSFDDDAEAICREALSVQNYNLDAYEALIYATTDYSVSESLELLNKITTNMYGYPLPMWDLINLLKDKHNLSTDIAKAETMLATKSALVNGTKVTSEDSDQPDACKTMANSILSLNSYEVAQFSLSGEDADTLQLTSSFSSDANMEYSLDGGESWTQANGASVVLSDDEISQVNSDDDILVRIHGMENYYTIDISKASAPKNLYNNDLENSVINATDTMEWSFDKSEWTSFADAEPDLSGDTTVYVRNATNGTTFASDAVELSYTADSTDVTKSYIKINRLSVNGCSTQATAHSEYAYNTIDGDINTIWHTNWTSNSDLDRYVIYELDDYTYLSAIDYVPRQDANNGRFTACQVYTSLDGENWTLAGSASGWAVNKETKTIDFDKPAYAKYVKVVGTSAYANFGSASMINFYEDLSVVAGDVDLDGNVNIRDATVLQKICANSADSTTEQEVRGDVDLDGSINIRDVTYIQRYCAKLIDTIPVITSTKSE